VPDLFGIKDTGQLTPGWARVREFYQNISRLPDTILDPALNKHFGDPDREGFQLVTRDQTQIQTASLTRQITQQVEANLRTELNSIRGELQQYRASQITKHEVQKMENRLEALESSSATKTELAQAQASTTQFLQMNQLMMEALMEKMAAHGILITPPSIARIPAGAPPTPISQAPATLYTEEETDHDVHMDEGEDDLDLSGKSHG